MEIRREELFLGPTSSVKVENPEMELLLKPIDNHRATLAKRWSRHRINDIHPNTTIHMSPSQNKKELEVANIDSQQIKLQQRRVKIREGENKLKILVEADVQPCRKQ